MEHISIDHIYAFTWYPYKLLCHPRTTSSQVSRLYICPSGRGGHCQQLLGRGCVPPRFWSTAGLTMKVGGVRARTQTTTVTKISTDIKATFGEKNNWPCEWYLCPPYVLFNQGGKVHPIDGVGEILLVHLHITYHMSHVTGLEVDWTEFWESSPEEDHVPAPHSWDPSGARAESRAQAEHKNSSVSKTYGCYTCLVRFSITVHLLSWPPSRYFMSRPVKHQPSSGEIHSASGRKGKIEAKFESQTTTTWYPHSTHPAFPEQAFATIRLSTRSGYWTSDMSQVRYLK